MGLYATTTSITNLVPFFLTGNTSASDTAGVNQFSAQIDRAESLVMAAASNFYDVASFTATSASGSNVPPLLRTLSEDMALGGLLLGSYVQDGQNKQTYLDNYTRATQWLELLRKGELPLAFTNGTLVGKRTTGRMLSNTEDYDPIFDQDDEKQWKVDDDRLDDLEEARD